jgi:hypothetical protein
VWAEISPDSMPEWSHEDGVFENLTALFYGLAGIGFIFAIKRSQMLKERSTRWIYFFLICWVVVMFFFMVEEVSWGQRIFDFDTPESFKKSNYQDEFNLHNYEYLSHDYYGLSTRLLSLMILLVGLVFPLLSLIGKFKELVQKYAFPIMPWAYAGLATFSYIFGKYYGVYNILPEDAHSEIKEFMFSLAILAFGIHAALFPDDIFKWRKKVPVESPKEK